jgi:hypothetical protein
VSPYRRSVYQIRGDDWVIEWPTLAWSDGTTISSGELSAATYRATVAGITGSDLTITTDPEPGVRIRIEVPRLLTAEVSPCPHGYLCDLEITFNNKRSTKLFTVIVMGDVTL